MKLSAFFFILALAQSASAIHTCVLKNSLFDQKVHLVFGGTEQWDLTGDKFKIEELALVKETSLPTRVGQKIQTVVYHFKVITDSQSEFQENKQFPAASVKLGYLEKIKHPKHCGRGSCDENQIEFEKVLATLEFINGETTEIYSCSGL